jgi:uncharacterized protein YndB with AHSA1/START domain
MKANEAPVVVEEVFDVPVEVAWKAITVIEEMRNWYFDNIPAFEARAGFETQFMVVNEGREFPHKWKMTEVLPMQRISYEWRFDGYPGTGLVTFELTGLGSATTLKLTNIVLDDFPDDVPEFERESCLGGWQYFIGQAFLITPEMSCTCSIKKQLDKP